MHTLLTDDTPRLTRYLPSPRAMQVVFGWNLFALEL